MTCNLYAPYYPVVRDFAVVTSHPPLVHGLETTFDADYADTHRPPVRGTAGSAKGMSLVWSPGAQKPLVKLIGSAAPGSTLYAETEQLDSPAIERALVAAVRRGVTVDLTMTYDAQWAAGMDTLKAGGVNLRVYQPGAPLYIHAKALSVNGDTAYVGSANLTTAMTSADRNVGVITTRQTIVRGVTSTLAGDFAGAAPY
jgi:phosphatidylserine/phosphatidylglycerophosphate/cardiolipin synthase-like enzyme